LTAGEARQDQRWYGRRTGRKLTAARQRLMETRLPELRIDAPAPGRIADLQGRFRGGVTEIWMEIGFGAGEHLAGQAARHPGVGFIGCEPYVNGVASLLALLESAGLDNVRIFDDDVRRLMPSLPDASLDRLYTKL